MRGRCGVSVGLAAILSGLGACGDLGTDPHADLVGEYTLLIYRSVPLPYSDDRTMELVRSATLRLQHGRRYEMRVESHSLGWITGTYAVRGDTVVLTSRVGTAERYHHRNETLEGEGSVFVRAGVEIPPEYQYVRYELQTCDGHPVSYMTPCYRRGEYFVYRSTIWLWRSGRYDVADSSVGGTDRDGGSYHLSGDSVTLSRMRSARRSGILRNDTLTLGTFVHLRSQ